MPLLSGMACRPKREPMPTAKQYAPIVIALIHFAPFLNMRNVCDSATAMIRAVNGCCCVSEGVRPPRTPGTH
jgi:hypothetical protein